jgi:hypothetical protein
MTRRWYFRAALAALVGLSLAVGLTRADGPAYSSEPLAVIEQGGGGFGGGGGGTPPAQKLNPAFVHKGPVRDYVHECMHHLGVGCWSHHNMYTCSSFHSEFIFVFGSCRQFFGEPCLPGPPEPPMPPGYGPPPSYLPQPGTPPGYPGLISSPAYGPPPGYLPQPGSAPTGYSRLLNSPGYGRGGCPSCQ